MMRDMRPEKTGARKKEILIAFLLLLVIGLTAGLIYAMQQENETAVLVDAGGELMPNDDNRIRVSVNAGVSVKSHTMQDLYFSNYNEDRNLQLKIIADDQLVYESPLLSPGETIQADVIDDETLQEGENEAVAEIYSYNLAGELCGRTNAVISLIKS